jgi:hypothetical protein
MPDPLPQLPILAQAFDAAYAACARTASQLPPRQQSDEILAAVARFCRVQVEAGRCGDDLGETMLVSALAAGGADPPALTRLLAAVNAQAADDAFPAAGLDPRNRHGWTAATPPDVPRIISRPSWREPTDTLLAELRRDTAGLSGQRLCEQLAANLQLAAGPAWLAPEQPAADAFAAQMLPVTIAAYYLYVMELRLRDLESMLEGTPDAER